MPKLKPLSKPEDIARVPVDQPVLIELPAAVASTEDAAGSDSGAGSAEGAQDRQAPDEVATLKTQIAALETAGTTRQAALDRKERERVDALRVAAEKSAEAERYRTEAQDSEKDSLARGLGGAQAERDAAKIAYKSAFEAGDGGAMADAQERIARAATDIRHYEREIASNDQRIKTQVRPQDRQQQQPSQSDILASVQNNPDLLPKEKLWIKEHPELVIDPSVNAELGVGYKHAMKKGLTRGTDAYFQFMNEFLGYAQPPANGKGAANGHDEDQQIDDTNGATIMAGAPVTRQATSMQSGRNTDSFRMTLSPETRELIKTLGITETEYVQNAKKLADAKRDDPERFGGGR